jgi:hypothetical protein
MTDTPAQPTRYAMIRLEVRVPADLRHDRNVATDIEVAAQDYASETYGRDYDGSEPAPATPNTSAMPAVVHGEPVVSAFRHLPLPGQTDDTYTVITRDEDGRYTVFRARFAPALGRWSIDTDHDVRGGLSWDYAAQVFTRLLASRVS